MHGGWVHVCRAICACVGARHVGGQSASAEATCALHFGGLHARFEPSVQKSLAMTERKDAGNEGRWLHWKHFFFQSTCFKTVISHQHEE